MKTANDANHEQSSGDNVKRKRQDNDETELPRKKRKVDDSPDDSSTDKEESSEVSRRQNSKHGHILVDIAKLQPFITCPLCDLFFLDCVTLVECMHSFCEGCLRKHFWFYERPEGDVHPFRCPVCDEGISGGNPVETKARPDLQKQNFTNKVQQLLKKATEPEKPQDRIVPVTTVEELNFSKYMAIRLIHNPTPEDPEGFGKLAKPVHRMEKTCTVQAAKKYVAWRLQDVVSPKDIQIFCNKSKLPELHSLEFIRRTIWVPWNNSKSDMELHYQYAGRS